MAFQSVIFPNIKLKHGVVREVIDPVRITGNGGREVRRRQQRWEKFVWTFPARILLEADAVAIHKFLRGVNMALDSFLFQDPHFPEFNQSKLLFRSGNTWYFNLPYDSTTAGTHPVFNPQMGGLAFRRNGSPIGDPSFAIDANGFPYVTVSGSSSGDTIDVTGPVYLGARWDGTLSRTIAAMELSPLGGTCNVLPLAHELGDFRLVEVWEHA